jgi:hypothetical protein
VASSGSYDFSVSRDDLIKDALLELGVLESGEAPTAEETTDCARRLNMMVKSWMVKGRHLWCVQDAVLFQVLGQQSYLLGSASGDANWCDPDDYVQTTLSADEASGQTVLSVTSVADMTAADRIGIVLDDGSIQWTTIDTVGASTVTVDDALTGDAASGAVVFVYTSRLVRPNRVLPGTIYRRDINNNDTPIELVGKTEYDMLTAKTQRGKTIKIAYQPLLNSGRLWTWSTADLSSDTLRFSVERPIQDFDLTLDNPDFPIEASKALYLGLAVDVAGIFGASDEVTRVKMLFDEALDDWLAWDAENAPVRFQPDMRRAGRSRRV